MDINWSNKSINNIEMPKEYTLIGNVVMNKQIHNTNVRPRNKVEYRRRSSKDIVFNELNPFRTKRTNTENNKIEDEISNEIEMINEEKYQNKISQPTKMEIINDQISNETMMEEIDEYDINLSNEQFEKVMNTFEIPNNCVLCNLSINKNICNLPDNLKETETKTIIFPFKSNTKYGIVAYVNKMKILNKRINKCLVQLKYEKSNYPSFLKGIRKTLKERFKLKNEPFIHSLQLKKCVKRYKYNGYFTLFLLESFIKTRKSINSKDQQKKLIEYLTDQNMIKSFRKYKRIIN